MSGFWRAGIQQWVPATRQLKYTLWKDRKAVARKNPEWVHILGKVHNICAIRSGVEEDEVIKSMVAQKRAELEDVIAYCKETGAHHSEQSLENAKADMFTSIENRLEGKTTSRVERLFRTVNMRVNVGQWTTQGALNVTKVRLAYYYNSFDA